MPRKADAPTGNPESNPATTMPGKNGGTLKRGGTNKGAGRPPNKFLNWCAGLLTDPMGQQQVEEILRDKNHPAFATMWKAVGERAYGKPVQPIGGDPDRPLSATVIIRRE